MPEPAVGPIRKRRITRACDPCHRSNTKCVPSPDPSTCQECLEFGTPCTYDRPVRRRGPRTASDPDRRAASIAHSAVGYSPSPVGWTYREVASAAAIAELAESYLTIVYPIFPLFHWPSFMSRLLASEYTTNRALFVSTMAMCAIVTARLRNGAVRAPRPMKPTPPPEVFAKAALDAFPARLVEAKGFEYVRAKALLAILELQQGHVPEHRTQLGEFVVMASNEGYQDESKWPCGLQEAELQERRRVFWSIYTLEIYSALTWGGTVRIRERQSNVMYPVEVDDEMIPPSPSEFGSYSDVSFMRGWNFTTDMYRMLEHLIDRLRSLKRTDPGQESLDDLFDTPDPAPRAVLDRLAFMYARLPDVFKTVKEMTGNIRIDRFGFQAANIIVTMQTVKLAVAAAEDQGVEERCLFANELVHDLVKIPTTYIAAVSRPMLHHLASCGQLLGTVVTQRLSQQALLQVRSVLISMADILSSLETALDFPADISSNLRTHVSRVEGYLLQGSHEPIARSPSALRTTTGPTPTFGYDQSQLPVFPPDFTFQFPADHQVQLRSDLTADWPSGLGGGFFDSLGDGLWDTSGPWLLPNTTSGFN